jgi:phenylpropionate dioxygenase-like ring-hydroxylating dioxygenase large terminal subunit
MISYIIWFILLENVISFKNIFNPFIISKTHLKNFISERNEINKELNHTKEFYHFGNFPRLEYPNINGQLTWYPIGFSKDFGINPKKITIRDINYVVWKDKLNYYGLRDCCSHQGSSFMLGETCKNTISCPYHGYIFDGSNGELIKIPKLQHIESTNYNIDCFKVVEKGDVVYLNTIPIINEEMKMEISECDIFIEPEYYDKNQRVVYLDEDFEHYAKFVSVNSLDICHIGFVHTFGNKKNPNPLHNSKILKLDDFNNHYKIIYNYLAGENSLVNKIYNFNNIIVENEYALPHSTVARVKFGNFSSTIITHALPISKFKTKLFVKAYRSYWSYDLNNSKNYNLFYPFLYLINLFGDKITHNTMYSTLKQDKAIVDYIDKTDYQSMHGKFSIVYDMFSNHYKNNYKKYYEDGPFSI